MIIRSIFRPFRIFSVSTTLRFAYVARISSIAFCTTLPRCTTVSVGRSNSDIRAYKPNTSSVGTKLFRLAMLLIALSTICKITSLLTRLLSFVSSALIIMYVRYTGL